MYLGSGINKGIISNNNASSNYYGIHLNFSSNITISNNVASINEYGIFLRDSINNIISNNIASANDYGIYLSYSSSNTLMNNTANSNDKDGIFFFSSSSNTLMNNTASNNNHGINLRHFCNKNILTKNIVNLNNEFGIYMDDSSNNIITNNIISNNKNSIRIEGSSKNTDFSDNLPEKDPVTFELIGITIIIVVLLAYLSKKNFKLKHFLKPNLRKIVLSIILFFVCGSIFLWISNLPELHDTLMDFGTQNTLSIGYLVIPLLSYLICCLIFYLYDKNKIGEKKNVKKTRDKWKLLAEWVAIYVVFISIAAPFMFGLFWLSLLFVGLLAYGLSFIGLTSNELISNLMGNLLIIFDLIFIGGVFGCFVGVMQSLVLHRHVKQKWPSDLWIRSSIVSFAAVAVIIWLSFGTLFPESGFGSLFDTLLPYEAWLIAILIFGPIIGACIGLSQMFLIRRYFYRAYLWVLSNVVAWTLALLATGSAEYIFKKSEYLLDLIGNSFYGDLFLFLAFPGAIVGIITGITLIWLLQHPKSEG